MAFLIYMITTYTLYVPDWSFVIHDNDNNIATRYTVCFIIIIIIYQFFATISL